MYLGQLDGEEVAVKMFSSRDKQTISHLLHKAELSCSLDDENVVQSYRYIIHIWTIDPIRHKVITL